jgi:hypothetical protein
LAASNKAKVSPAPPSNSARVAVPQDLQAVWQSLLQAVSEQLGASVHVPLASAQPRREGGVVVARFTGHFAIMAKYLEKRRDQLQEMLSVAAGESLGLRFELDESTPPPKTVPMLQTPRSDGSGTAPAPAAASIALAVPREGIPITPELREQLEKDPLIRSLLEGFNGNIVKVENEKE